MKFRGQTQTDIVVVGTGAAGLSAALAASVAGARVLVLEKAAVIGGTTAMSGGCIWVPGHHYMAAMGLSDSREKFLSTGMVRGIRAVLKAAVDGLNGAACPIQLL